MISDLYCVIINLKVLIPLNYCLSRGDTTPGKGVGNGFTWVPEQEAERNELPQSLRDSFSSGNGQPFVCVADISPDRGITFQERKPIMTNSINKISSPERARWRRQPTEGFNTVDYC